MPINVTLEARNGSLYWGPVRIAAVGTTGRVSLEVWRALVSAGLIRPRLPAGHLSIGRCDRCRAAILAHPITRYCRSCRRLVNKQQHGQRQGRRKDDGMTG